MLTGIGLSAAIQRRELKELRAPEEAAICKTHVENAQRQINEIILNANFTYSQAINQMKATGDSLAQGTEESLTSCVDTAKLNKQFKILQTNKDTVGIVNLYKKTKKAIEAHAIRSLDRARSLNARALAQRVNSCENPDKRITTIIEKLIKNESLAFYNSKDIKLAKALLKHHQIAYFKRVLKNNSSEPSNPSSREQMSSALEHCNGIAFDWSKSSKDQLTTSAKNQADGHYAQLTDMYRIMDTLSKSEKHSVLNSEKPSVLNNGFEKLSENDSPRLENFKRSASSQVVEPAGNLQPAHEHEAMQREFLEQCQRVFASWSDFDHDFAHLKGTNIEKMTPEDISGYYTFFSGKLNKLRTKTHTYDSATHTITRTPLGGLSSQTVLADDMRNFYRKTDTIVGQGKPFSHHTYRNGNLVDPKLLQSDPGKAKELAKSTAQTAVKRIVSDELSVNQNFFRTDHSGRKVYDLVSVSLQGGGFGTDTADEQMNFAQIEAYESLRGKTLTVTDPRTKNNVDFQTNPICFAFATNWEAAAYQGDPTKRFTQNRQSFHKLLDVVADKIPLKAGKEQTQAQTGLTSMLSERFGFGHNSVQFQAIVTYLTKNFQIEEEEAVRVVTLLEDLNSLIMIDRFSYQQNCPNEAPAKLDLLFAELNALSKSKPSCGGQLRMTTNCKSAKDRTTRADATTTAFISERAKDPNFKKYPTTHEFRNDSAKTTAFFENKVERHEHDQLDLVSFSNLYGATGTKYSYPNWFAKVFHMICRGFGTGKFHPASKANTIYGPHVKN